MAIPIAPLENAGTGDKLLFLTYDNSGTNAAALLRAYKQATVNATVLADLGVYPTSGNIKNGNRNAVDTNILQLNVTSTPCQGVLVKAREANVNDVWVGGSTTTADTTEATGGFRLAPGASVSVPCRNLTEVYIIWSVYTAGDGVEYLASID